MICTTLTEEEKEEANDRYDEIAAGNHRDKHSAATRTREQNREIGHHAYQAENAVAKALDGEILYYYNNNQYDTPDVLIPHIGKAYIVSQIMRPGFRPHALIKYKQRNHAEPFIYVLENAGTFEIHGYIYTNELRAEWFHAGNGCCKFVPNDPVWLVPIEHLHPLEHP